MLLRARRWLWFALGLAAGALATVGAQRLYGADGFFKASWDMALAHPITPTKVLGLVAALVTLAALPLAVADLRSERRFHREERDLRSARPSDEVTPYEGPEGSGLRFDGPEGALLLLRATSGFGQPRVVRLDAPAAADDAPPGEPAFAAESSAR